MTTENDKWIKDLEKKLMLYDLSLDAKPGLVYINIREVKANPEIELTVRECLRRGYLKPVPVKHCWRRWRFHRWLPWEVVRVGEMFVHYGGVTRQCKTCGKVQTIGRLF